jgi:hypothetical protein
VVNHNTGVYYQVNFICKLKVKGMGILGEMWWRDKCLDTFTIHDIDKISTGQALFG